MVRKKKVCKQCGYILKKNSNFCSNCGIAINKYCSFCGKRLSVDELYCRQCGRVVNIFNKLSDDDVKIFDGWNKTLPSDSWKGNLPSDGFVPSIDDLRGCQDEQKGASKNKGSEEDEDLESVVFGEDSYEDFDFDEDDLDAAIKLAENKRKVYPSGCPFFNEPNLDCEECEEAEYLGCEFAPKRDEDEPQDNNNLLNRGDIKDSDTLEEDKYKDLELKVINDSGFYTNRSLANKVTLNTNKYFYFAKKYDNYLNMIDKDMKGKYVDLNESTATNEEKRIEAMTIRDGLLVVLVSVVDNTHIYYRLEYYSPELVFIKSEMIRELNFMDISYPMGTYSRTCLMDSDSIMILAKYKKKIFVYNTEIDASVIYYNFEDKTVQIIRIDGSTIKNLDDLVKGKIADIDNVYKTKKKTYFVMSTYEKVSYEDDKTGYKVNKILVGYNRVIDKLDLIWDRNRDGQLPLFYDFDNNTMWTFVSRTECRKLKLTDYKDSKYICVREISPNHIMIEPTIIRRVSNDYVKNLMYFDCEFMCAVLDTNELAVIDEKGEGNVWPVDENGRVRETLFWQNKVIGDLMALDDCFYWEKGNDFLHGIIIDGVNSF